MFRLCLYRHKRRRSHALRGTAFSYAYAIGLVSTLFLCCAATIVSAAPDSTRQVRPASVPVALLALVNLNFDCYADSVYGWQDEQAHFLPHEIHWGLPPSGSASNNDSVCASQTPKQARKHITTIIYPDWKHFTGSVAFERMNDDSLADLVLYMWGDAGGETGNTGDSGNGLARRDSLRALVIFSQIGLDSLNEITLASISKFQSEPYFAMELTPGVDLRNPQARDLSGVPSYEIKRVALDVRPRKKDTTEHHGPVPSPLAGVASGAADPVEVHVYPNPSAGAAQIEAVPIPAGEYTIEIVAVNGIVCLRQDVAVSDSRSLFGSLDVTRLASGYYVVRLLGHDANASGQPTTNRIVGTYPIVVTR